MRYLMRINTNWYATDSVEVVEVNQTGVKDGYKVYEVNIHTQSGKSFTAHHDCSFEDALRYRDTIIKTMASPPDDSDEADSAICEAG